MNVFEQGHGEELPINVQFKSLHQQLNFLLNLEKFKFTWKYT